MVSRAMILAPMAAWMGITNIWRGISSLSFSQKTRPRLVADGLYFVGVDLVGDKILEINVFAPGGIANINDLYELDVGTAVIRDLERKVELRSVYPEPIPPHVFMRA